TDKAVVADGNTGRITWGGDRETRLPHVVGGDYMIVNDRIHPVLSNYPKYETGPVWAGRGTLDGCGLAAREWCGPRAHGPQVAPTPRTTKAQVRSGWLLTWAFACGADDGNRTRVLSLGINRCHPEDGGELQ